MLTFAFPSSIIFFDTKQSNFSSFEKNTKENLATFLIISVACTMRTTDVLCGSRPYTRGPEI